MGTFHRILFSSALAAALLGGVMAAPAQAQSGSFGALLLGYHIPGQADEARKAGQHDPTQNLLGMRIYAEGSWWLFSLGYQRVMLFGMQGSLWDNSAIWAWSNQPYVQIAVPGKNPLYRVGAFVGEGHSEYTLETNRKLPGRDMHTQGRMRTVGAWVEFGTHSGAIRMGLMHIGTTYDRMRDEAGNTYAADLTGLMPNLEGRLSF